MTARGHGSLLAFFALAFAIMWPCFIAVALAVPVTIPLGGALVVFGAWAPAMAAVFLTHRSEGRAGVRELLRRVVQADVGLRWYGFAVGYMLAIQLASALIHRLVFGAWPRLGDTPPFLIPFAIALSTPVQAGEEIGWRGYALPRLAARFGWAPASLLLGVVWGFWHLPQFFIRDGGGYGHSVFVFTLMTMAISVALAYLYVRTRGSLLLCMVMHAAINNSLNFAPSTTERASSAGVFGFTASPLTWITTAQSRAVALFCLLRMPNSRGDGTVPAR